MTELTEKEKQIIHEALCNYRTKIDTMYIDGKYPYFIFGNYNEFVKEIGDLTEKMYE